MAIVDQGGLGLPDRDYYFRDDAKSVELRTQYVEHVGKMLALAGAPADRADGGAEQVMRDRDRAGEGALDAVARRDPNKVYHKMTIAELQALTPHFDWARYFTGVGAPPITRSTSTEPEFFKAFDQRARRDAARPTEGLPALARRARVGAPCCRSRSSTRTSTSTARR